MRRFYIWLLCCIFIIISTSFCKLLHSWNLRVIFFFLIFNFYWWFLCLASMLHTDGLTGYMAISVAIFFLLLFLWLELIWIFGISIRCQLNLQRGVTANILIVVHLSCFIQWICLIWVRHLLNWFTWSFFKLLLFLSIWMGMWLSFASMSFSWYLGKCMRDNSITLVFFFTQGRIFFLGYEWWIDVKNKLFDNIFHLVNFYNYVPSII